MSTTSKVPAEGLASALDRCRVLVCAGTGGVGKTTISAALALQAARRGRRTLVLTIDPARRLADALGLEHLEATPTPVDLAKLDAEEAGPTRSASATEGGAKSGSLDAMMLDTKPTFDALVSRLTDDEEALRRILDNRIYRHMTEALAGSAEYAAMEQVHERVESGRYDLVVVDTPPADHALDFLRAPRRLRDFLESRFVKTLVRPAMSASRIGLRLFGRPLHRMLGLLERIAGVGFLDDLSEFLSAIDGLSEGFRERATRVEQVLLGEQTGFVLVCGVHSGDDGSTREFLEELSAFGVPLAAVVVNRVRPWPLEEGPAESLARWQGEAWSRDAVRLREALDGLVEAPEAATTNILAALREAAFARLEAEATLDGLAARAASRGVRCHDVPELPGDVDRLSGLLEIGRRLLPTEPSADRDRDRAEAADEIASRRAAR